MRMGSLKKEKAKKNLSGLTGREQSYITVYPEGEWSDCPDCKYDPINKVSVNPNCLKCKGLGRIEVVSSPFHIPAQMRWLVPEDREMVAIGYISTGACRLRVKGIYRKRMEEASRIIVPDGIKSTKEMQVLKDENKKLRIKPLKSIDGEISLIEVLCEVKPIQ